MLVKTLEMANLKQKASPAGEAASGSDHCLMRADPAMVSHQWVKMANMPLIRLCGATFPPTGEGKMLA